MPKLPYTKQMLLWGAVLLFVRLALLIGVGVALKEKSFTDDWRGILAFVETPFQILTGQNQGGFSFWPPLFPVLIAAIGKPLSALTSDYYTVRGISVVFEMLCWPGIWLMMCRFQDKAKGAPWAAALAYICAPVAFMTTSLMGQDESVALLFFLAVFVCISRGWITLGCLVCGVGVIAAKVYLLIPIAALVLGPAAGFKTRVWRAAVGLIPVVLVYGYVQVISHSPSPSEITAGDGATETILDFTPHGLHAVSAWALPLNLFGWSIGWVKYASAATALAGALGILGWTRARYGPLSGDRLILVITAMILSVFLLFYHCDPEYYIMVLPVTIAVLHGLARWFWAVGLLSVVYGVNLAYGVAYAKEHGGSSGKQVFVDLYDRLIPFDPSVFHLALLVTVILVNLALLFQIGRRLTRVSPNPKG